MYKILIAAENTEETSVLSSSLQGRGFFVTVVSNDTIAIERIEGYAPDLLLIDHAVISQDSTIWGAIERTRVRCPIPTILLISVKNLEYQENIQHSDDFIVRPFTTNELVARIRHVLQRVRPIENKNLVKCDDLTIDLERCQVFVAGRRVALTFKEYELLTLLAMNIEKVLTRQALLEIVWGKDYHGGDRTVDVHIRRLRSKIEDANHAFIETVRNLGYRFKKG